MGSGSNLSYQAHFLWMYKSNYEEDAVHDASRSMSQVSAAEKNLNYADC